MDSNSAPRRNENSDEYRRRMQQLEQQKNREALDIFNNDSGDLFDAKKFAKDLLNNKNKKALPWASPDPLAPGAQALTTTTYTGDFTPGVMYAQGDRVIKPDSSVHICTVSGEYPNDCKFTKLAGYGSLVNDPNGVNTNAQGNQAWNGLHTGLTAEAVKLMVSDMLQSHVKQIEQLEARIAELEFQVEILDEKKD